MTTTENDHAPPLTSDVPVELIKRIPNGGKRRFWIVAGSALYIPVAVWACGALWFDLPFKAAINAACAVAWLIGAAAVPLAWRRRARGLKLCAVLLALIVLWWLSLRPKQDRDWQPEYALPPTVRRYGDRVTIENVRNFDFSVPGAFKKAYETRVYDLKNLRSVDLFLTYWGHEYIAHPFLSFDFGPDGRIAFSIETRREKGEGYSTLGGLYKMFELIYIAGDERDLVLKRAMNGEDVYLYPGRLNLGATRQLFLEYLARIEELAENPEFYGLIGANCTTSVRAQRSRAERSPWDWRLLANGKLDELLYERGDLDKSKPFTRLKREARVNDLARENKNAADFSSRIRRRE